MRSRTIAVIAATLFLAFLLVVILSAAGWNPTGIEWNFSNSGQFGDSFGFLSSFMAATAALAAWAAYRLQHKEVEHLRASDLAGRELAEKRDFEQTFFNLLELFRDVVKEVDVEGADGSLCQGRDALAEILRTAEGISAMNGGALDADEQAFAEVYRTHREDLAHYFRLFYHIVKYVHETELKSKKIYIRLIRATLSNSEIVLIALDCIYGGGKLKLKPLVEQYKLLHNISQSAIERWRMLDFLSDEAFGDRRTSASAQL